MYRVGIITASDKGSRGERVDESGAKIKEVVGEFGYEVKFYKVLPDDKDVLAEEMKSLSDKNEVDLILTTGGTGFSKRDNTTEATLSIAEKLVPGISEAIRAYSMQFTKKAMLSRAVSVIRKSTLIINMPGSPKAVKEQLAPRIKKDDIIISNLWKAEDAKEEIPETAIPLCNGFCCKQIDTGICKKANTCLNCPMFIPSIQFISSYMIQIQEIEATIAIAKNCGYTKMLENCMETKKILEDIIKRLEEKRNE